jgi:integrase
MASLSRDKNGTKRVQWTNASGKRQTIRLGRMPVKAAQSVKVHLERLIGYHATNTAIDVQTAQWLNGLPDTLYAKLVNHGLAAPRVAREVHTLGSMLDEYFQTMNVKESTRIRYAQTQRLLIEYFGVDRTLDSIMPRDGDQWRAWMVDKGFADAKVGRDVRGARMFFRKAMQWGMIEGNPFADVKAAPQTSNVPKRFITPAEAAQLIEAAPDADWRCIIALARYGGLRCPSEVLRVRWADVDWSRNRMRVRSPKTERHAGKGERFVPLFPELRAVLMDAFELAPEGAEFVVHHHRDSTANLRTHLRRIIERAGMSDWPKLFNSMRSSRATELMNQYPAKLCTEWMGHSQAIAEAHYQQVRDEDYTRAASTPIAGVSQSGACVSQNASQHVAAQGGTDSQANTQTNKGPAFMPIPSTSCSSVQSDLMGIRGLEPRTPAFSMPCSTN